MGLYYRKRIKLSDNIRINVGRKSSSLSIGKKGSTINFGKRGVYMTFGIPGTGFYFRSKIFSTTKKTKNAKQKTPIKTYNHTKTNTYKPKKKQMAKTKTYSPMSFAEFIICLVFLASFASIFISWLIPLFLGMSWIWSIIFICVSIVFCYFMSEISRKYTSKYVKERLANTLNESNSQKIREENGLQEDVLPNEENTTSDNTQTNQIENETEKTVLQQDDNPKIEEPVNNDDVSEETVKWLVDNIAKENAGYINIIPDVRNFDPLFEEAAQFIVANQCGSTTLVQRRFSIGYNRAWRIMDQLEHMNIVGSALGSKPREVLLRDENELNERIYAYNKNIDEFKELHKSEIEEKTQYYLNLMKEETEAEVRAYMEAEKARLKQQILENKHKRELRKQALEELKKEGLIENVKKREPIPQEVQNAVWRRDGGRCVKCGSQENLEFDHIIPFSKGGSNTVRNLQLLCEKCNREKSNNIG